MEFVLLLFVIYLLWRVEWVLRMQRLLARRILGLDVPEVGAKLNASSEVELERDDVQKMIPVLRSAFPPLVDAKKMLRFLEGHGLSHKEIRTAIYILNDERQKIMGGK